jgi:type IV secretion system protein VirD4
MAEELYRLPAGGRLRAAGLYPVWVIGIYSGVVLSVWVATQWLAWQWAYADGLGPAWLTLGSWKLYAPWQCVLWWWRLHTVPQADAVLRGALDVMAWVLIGSIGCTTLMVIRRARQVGGQSDLHGSAHWATKRDIKKMGLFTGAGVYIGAWDDGRVRRYLQHNGPHHVLAMGPTRAGKGASFVIPTALTWPGSLVVNDPKNGENWLCSAGWRKAQGQRVLRFDPTCTDGTAAHYNPLLEVRPWPYDVRDAQLIAEAIIERDAPHAVWDHWHNTAYGLLVGVILHVLYAERDKTLTGCLHFLTNPHRTIIETLQIMKTTVHDPGETAGWLDPHTGAPTGTHPEIASVAQAQLNLSPKELSSVVSSVLEHFNPYHDPIVQHNIDTCDFALSDLLDPAHPVTLYLGTPTAHLARTAPLTRVVLHQLTQRLTETMADPRRGWSGSRDGRILLMIDEFPLLGRMTALIDKLGIFAGYGVSLYLIAQDRAQIEERYGKHESITANCQVQIAFAPNTVETAEWIAKRTGQRTVHREQRTYTGSRFALYLPHVIASEGESQRPLLTPDEVLRLSHGGDDPRDPGDVLIFISGEPPIKGKKSRYYYDAEFVRRATTPPPAASDRIAHDWSHWLHHPAVLGTPASPEAATVTLGLSDDLF